MSLQGQTTLSDDEKRTEAKKHVDYLTDFLEQMLPHERSFITRLSDNFESFGNRTNISNKQLFWLRDLIIKY